MKLQIVLALGLATLLTACNSNTSDTATATSQKVEHTASENQMVGTWKFKDLDFDFKINVDLPGIERTIKQQLNEQVKKTVSDITVTYNNDGTFNVNGGKDNADGTKGTYKIENNQLTHTNFAQESSIINYANAQVNNDVLTLQIDGEQFWKMMETLNNVKGGVGEMQKMITINKLTYTFSKI